MLRWLVGFLSICGFIGWGLMFLFIVGMGGFGAGSANSAVVFVLATPVAFFALCFFSVVGKFTGPFLLVVIAVVVALTLPFFWYLVINGAAGLIGAAILGGFLAMWLLVCVRQLRSDAQLHSSSDSPASRAGD